MPKGKALSLAISIAARVNGSPTMDSANTAAPSSQSSAVNAPPNTNQMTLPAKRMMGDLKGGGEGPAGHQMGIFGKKNNRGAARLSSRAALSL